MNYLQSIFLSSLFLCQLILSAYAQPVAQVYGIKGNVSKNKEQVLKLEDPIYQKDLLQTDLESMLLLLLHNGYLVKIDEDLSLKVEDIILLKAKKATLKPAQQLNQLLGSQQRSDLQIATIETFAITHSEELAQSASMLKEEYQSSSTLKDAPSLKKPSPKPSPKRSHTRVSASPMEVNTPANAPLSSQSAVSPSSSSAPGTPIPEVNKQPNPSHTAQHKDQEHDHKKADGLGLEGTGEGGGGRGESRGIGLASQSDNDVADSIVNHDQNKDHQLQAEMKAKESSSDGQAEEAEHEEIALDIAQEKKAKESSSDGQAKEIAHEELVILDIDEATETEKNRGNTKNAKQNEIANKQKAQDTQKEKVIVAPIEEKIQQCIQEALPDAENFDEAVTSINVTIYVKTTNQKPFRIQKLFLGGGLSVPNCLNDHRLLAKLPFFKTARPQLLKHVVTIDLKR